MPIEWSEQLVIGFISTPSKLVRYCPLNQSFIVRSLAKRCEAILFRLNTDFAPDVAKETELESRARNEIPELFRTSTKAMTSYLVTGTEFRISCLQLGVPVVVTKYWCRYYDSAYNEYAYDDNLTAV